MEGVSNREFLVDALKNNSFSLFNVERTITDIVNKSFNNLYEYQLNKIGLHRFNFTSSNIIINNGKMELVVSKDLIEQIARKSYRLSPFFNKQLTLEDMESDRNSFLKIPLVFIDGRPVFNYKVSSYKDKTIIIFDYDKNLIETFHTFTVIYVYNNGITKGVLNKYIAEKYNYNVPVDKFFNIKRLSTDYDGLVVASVLSEDNTGSSFFSIGNIPDGISTLSLPKNTSRSINTQNVFTSVILSIPFLNDIDRVYKVRTNANNEEKIELFVIRDKNGKTYHNPIPVENILIFKRDKISDEFILDNNCTIKLHYPNIYEITDPNQEADDEYMVKYFYVPLNDNTSYTNKLDVFYYLIRKDFDDNMSFEDIINEIYFSDNTDYKYHDLFNEYFNYTDYIYTYSISDFRGNYYPNHFNYKVDKFWEFVRNYPEHLREYIKEQHKIGRLYWLDVRDIDLESRIRIDNTTECPNNEVVTFDKEHYVFAFYNDGTSYLNLRFFIDGLLFSPKYIYIANSMQYIYVPVDLINENSFLEIEKFEDFFFSEEITLLEHELGKEFHIYTGNTSENFIPTVSDIFFINKKTGEILDKDKFIISVEIDNIYTVIENTSYTHLGKINIKLKDSTYSNIPIYVRISKNSVMMNYQIENNGVIFHKRLTTPNFNRCREYIRVFYNGRLLPESLWSMSSTNGYEAPSINIKYIFEKGDNIVIDLTPFKYRKIYSKQKINEDGIINLDGFIDKPFDLAFYDSYINGRKLTENNIKYITPTKIKLVNVKSLSNFVIYEKDRDDEYFYINYLENQSKMIEDKLIENTDVLTNNDISDIITYIVGGVYPDNTDDESVVEASTLITDGDLDLIAFYNDELSKQKHLNPDIYQFFKSDIDKYQFVSNDMISDGTSESPNVIILNPDKLLSAPIVLRIGSPDL